MATEKRRFSIRNLFRRTTPKPADRKVFNIGIQEKRQGLMMTTPLLYEIATQSVITRTCTTGSLRTSNCTAQDSCNSRRINKKAEIS